jgi:hypothetical protein
MHQLAEVGGDHVGGGGKAGAAAEFRHDLAAGIASLGAARIFGIGEHIAASLAQADRFFQ